MDIHTYSYVGPKDILKRALLGPVGAQVETADDVLRWIEQSNQELNSSRSITATFVIDKTGQLRIADRRSEHVRCAGGIPVRSAGEMTFTVMSGDVQVSWVTNQSTGYCPEPESWHTVKKALDDARIIAPDRFSQEFIFRRCVHCGSINIVKERVFECSVCSSDLPPKWNLK